MANFTTPPSTTGLDVKYYSLALEANANVTNIANITTTLTANVTKALGGAAGDSYDELVATVVTVLCITVTIVFCISLLFLALEKHRQTGKRRAENFSSHSRRYALEVGQLRRVLQKDKKSGKKECSDDEETDVESENSPSLVMKQMSAPKITVTNATPERKQKDFNFPLLSVSHPCELNEEESDIETARREASHCSSSIVIDSSVDSLFTGDNSSSDYGEPSSSSVQRTASIRSDSFLQTAHYPHRKNCSIETVQSVGGV